MNSMRGMAVLMVALCVSSLAMATVVPEPTPTEGQPGGEQSLWEIYRDLYGVDYGDNATLTAAERVDDLQVFNLGDAEGMRVEARVRYAFVESEFGWYEPAGTSLFDNPGAANPLFNVTETGYVSGYSDWIMPSGDFGFYLRPSNPDGSSVYWHSEQHLNWELQDHLVVYRTPDENVLMLAWEDLPFTGTLPGYDVEYGYDEDYNDLIVEIRYCVVPEPTTMLLLGLGIAGMAARRFRKMV